MLSYSFLWLSRQNYLPVRRWRALLLRNGDIGCFGEGDTVSTRSIRLGSPKHVVSRI